MTARAVFEPLQPQSQPPAADATYRRGQRVRMTGTQALGTVTADQVRADWVTVRWDGNGQTAATHINDIVLLGQPDPTPGWRRPSMTAALHVTFASTSIECPPALVERAQRTHTRMVTAKIQQKLDRCAASFIDFHLNDRIAGRPTCAGHQHLQVVVEEAEGSAPAIAWLVSCRRCGPLGCVARLELDA